MQKKTLTIGILAHVDAGKTSLTECLLYTAGATKNRGSVDKGSAITDGLAMEKNRGISINDKIRAYKGVSPLDEAQWILHNRGAFKADERRR